MRVVVLIPRRADDGRRDRIWAWVKARWEMEHPAWDIYEGHHDDGPFNRSIAINRAAWHAETDSGPWDVAIIADSDSFVGSHQITEAVHGAHDTARMWLAYDRFCYLSRMMSDQVMDGYVGMWEPGVEWWLPGTCSSMVVVRRDVWDQCRGFDEGFTSWGMEDVAFSHAAQTFGGGLSRAKGACWHLWHSPNVNGSQRSGPEWEAKVARAERYHEAAYDKPAMRALLDELNTSDVLF